MVRVRNLLKIFIVILVVAFGWANFDFTAQEIAEGDRYVGQILYKDKAIISFYNTGPFVTTYSRAQMTAYRLNEYIEKYEDIDLIRLSYPENIYTASIGGRNLFSAYKEDAKHRNMKVEALMAEWMNHLKSAMIQQKVELQEQEIVIQSNEEESPEVGVAVDSIIITKDQIKTVSTQDAQIVSDMLLIDIEERLEALEKKVDLPVRKSKTSKMVWVFMLFNLGLSIYVLVMYLKANKQLGNYEEIEKTGRLEELENSVSVLLKELKDVSGEAVDSVIKTVKEQKQVDVKEEPKEEETHQDLPETVEVVDNKPDLSKIDIVPEVEAKTIINKQNNDAQEAIDVKKPEVVPEDNTSLADTLEEALHTEDKSKEVISNEDLKELEKEEVKTVKTDAEKLAEELDGGNEEIVTEEGINNSIQSNLSGVGIAELFKILSQLDKEIREEVKIIINNKALNKNDKIIKMKQMEIGNDLIAKVLGIGKEEVNLVVQLNNLE